MEPRISTRPSGNDLPASLYGLQGRSGFAEAEATYAGPTARWTDAASSDADETSDAAAAQMCPITADSAAPVSEEALREHLPMVRFLALRIRERLPQQVEMEDLISAGIVGLMDALQKFDATKKVQFRTYAQFRVRGAILDSLRALDWGPRDLRRKGRAVEEAIRSLSAKSGKAPSEQEVAMAMGLDLAAYQQLLGELSGLELGSLNASPLDDSGVEALALIPAGRKMTRSCSVRAARCGACWPKRLRTCRSASAWS